MFKFSKIKILFIVLTFALCFNSFNAPSATASTVAWTDWNSQSIVTGITNGYAEGSINWGAENIDISLNGLIDEFIDGDAYYNNSSTGYTSPDGTYGGLAPSDVIKESESGLVTLNFSKPVVDPYMSMVSVGGLGNWVNYAFQNLQNPMEVISYGPNQWGYGGYTITGNSFTGDEFNGVLKLPGIYSSLVFDISPSEYWHGFNIGAAGLAVPVPEPTSVILLGLGAVGGLLGIRRRKAA